MPRSLFSFLLLSFAMLIAGTTLAIDAHGQPQGAKKARPTQVRVVTMASGLVHPWSIAFLPNGDMLVTERPGRLRLVRDGRLDPEPIAGVPKVHAVRLSGLMEILPHPNFTQNQVVYLTYTKDVADNMVATTLARARFDGHQLLNVKDILICDPWQAMEGRAPGWRSEKTACST
jgi:glucose/arabinose dehydrogenase